MQKIESDQFGIETGDVVVVLRQGSKPRVALFAKPELPYDQVFASMVDGLSLEDALDALPDLSPDQRELTERFMMGSLAATMLAMPQTRPILVEVGVAVWVNAYEQLKDQADHGDLAPAC